MKKTYITTRINNSGEWTKLNTIQSSIDTEIVRNAVNQEYKGKFTATGSPIVSFTEESIMVTFEVSEYEGDKTKPHMIDYEATPLRY